jgi:hypothetical protein
LEEMVLPGSNMPCPEFHKRILRINFEVALAELRRYAFREREMYFRTPLAPPVQLNHSLVRMFVPPDLHHPSIEWNMVSEPEGQVHRVPAQGHMHQVIHAQHQDVVSKVVSGAYYPNSGLNMPHHRNVLDRVMNNLVEDRDRQLHHATRYPLALSPIGLGTSQLPIPPLRSRGRPRVRQGNQPLLPALPNPAPSALGSAPRQEEPPSTSGLSGVSIVPVLNLIPTTVASASVTHFGPPGRRAVAPPNSPEVDVTSRRSSSGGSGERVGGGEEEAEDLSSKRRKTEGKGRDWSPIDSP